MWYDDEIFFMFDELLECFNIFKNVKSLELNNTNKFLDNFLNQVKKKL